MAATTGWFYRAVLSAVFAARAAIFANTGIQGVDAALATLIRTEIIIVGLWTSRPDRGCTPILFG